MNTIGIDHNLDCPRIKKLLQVSDMNFWKLEKKRREQMYCGILIMRPANGTAAPKSPGLSATAMTPATAICIRS